MLINNNFLFFSDAAVDIAMPSPYTAFIPIIFNYLKQKKLIFYFFVNRNWKKLTDSRERAKILGDNRKNHHPIETL